MLLWPLQVKYWTKMFPSFKGHLPHCGTCEADQPRAVFRQGRIFRARVHTVQKYKIKFPGKASSSRSSMISFKPLKCNFLNTSFYNQKQRGLVVHFQHWISLLFGIHTEKMETQPKINKGLFTEKTSPPSNISFCNKCDTDSISQDTLMYHFEHPMCTRSWRISWGLWSQNMSGAGHLKHRWIKVSSPLGVHCAVE